MFESILNKNKANGYPSLNSNTKIDKIYLPNYVLTVNGNSPDSSGNIVVTTSGSSIPTLQEVVNQGNTITGDIKLLNLKIYDQFEDLYNNINFADATFLATDYNGNNVLSASQDSLQLFKTNSIRAQFFSSALTTNRDYYLPNAAGIIPLTVNGIGANPKGNIILENISDTNFANTNLTLTSNRIHDANSFSLSIYNFSQIGFATLDNTASFAMISNGISQLTATSIFLTSESLRISSLMGGVIGDMRMVVTDNNGLLSAQPIPTGGGGGGVTTETDPIFTASPAYSITNTNKTNWDNAYSWGNHATVGYLTYTSLVGYATQSYVNSQGFITSSALSPYLTIAIADSTYYPIGNPNNYITSSALSPYLTSSTASTTYVALSGSYTNPSWITSLVWSKITSTPTTLSGYGITDAYPLTGNPSAFITASALTPYLLSSTAASTYLTITNAAATYSILTHTHTFASLTSKPTTVSGYGITDVQDVPLSSYSKTVGTVANGDSIKQAIQKLEGSINNKANLALANISQSII